MAGTYVKIRCLDARINEETPGPSQSNIDTTTSTIDSAEGKNVLGERTVTSDVTLVVEGRELYANRAVLAHFSPVFQAMFFSDFKEKSENRVELRDKEFRDMVTLFNVLLMPASEAKQQLSDESLLQLLTLADEYQMDQVKAICQDYIGSQLFDHFRNFYQFHTTTPDLNTISGFDGFPLSKGSMHGQKIKRKALVDKLVLYLMACGQYQLHVHQEDVQKLLVAVTKSKSDLCQSRYYQSLPSDTKIALLETLCEKTFNKLRSSSGDDKSDDDEDSMLHTAYTISLPTGNLSRYPFP